MMKCERCQGFLVRDSIYNHDGQYHHIDVLRCLNCGETVDMAILKARALKKNKGEPSERHAASRNTRKSLVSKE